jgi:hypothetical protein
VQENVSGHDFFSRALEFLSMNFLRGSWKLLILGQGSFGHSGVMTLNEPSSRPSGSATRGTQLHFVQLAWARWWHRLQPVKVGQA